jgi:aminomethyltransferase
MSEAEALRRTPLYERHRQLGAKMVPFSGWEMPVQYEGILAEHHAVRTAAGLFDVTHMGRVEIHGPDAIRFLNYLTVNDVERLDVYQSQYTVACYEHGGIVDDLLVYRCPDRMLVVLNAGNRAKDLAWLHEHRMSFDVRIVDLSDETALIALQGPGAQGALEKLTALPLDGLLFHRFFEGTVAGVPARVFRTGYTGEDGFEIWYPADKATVVWDALLEAGGGSGLRPCGLGARDTLRLEAGLCLYGHEIDETTNPLEAGLGWITRLKKPDFIGRAALLDIRSAGLSRRLAGFRVLERGIPRQGYVILSEGRPVGVCVSGTMSPTLGYGIGTGYVPIHLAEPGSRLDIDIRGRHLPAEVVKLPFYAAGSRR